MEKLPENLSEKAHLPPLELLRSFIKEMATLQPPDYEDHVFRWGMQFLKNGKTLVVRIHLPIAPIRHDGPIPPELLELQMYSGDFLIESLMVADVDSTDTNKDIKYTNNIGNKRGTTVTDDADVITNFFERNELSMQDLAEFIEGLEDPDYPPEQN